MSPCIKKTTYWSVFLPQNLAKTHIFHKKSKKSLVVSAEVSTFALANTIRAVADTGNADDV